MTAKKNWQKKGWKQPGRKKGSGLTGHPEKDSSSEIISKLEHGHTEGQTVALLALMEELGFDYNDLRERKAVNDARLAAEKVAEKVLQQPIDALFRWHEAEHSRALSTRDDKWFEGQRKAIRAFKTGKLKSNRFGVAVLRACVRMVWANRAQSQKNTAQRWREQRRQRERDIARRMHGKKINPKVAEEMERERKRQVAMTDSERAERIRKRDEQLLANEKPMTPSEKREQRKKQREHVAHAVREQKRQAEQARGSYRADFVPAGQRLYRLTGVNLHPEDVFNELKYIDRLVESFPDGRLKVAGRIFKGDRRHDAQAHACDEIRKLMQMWFPLMFVSTE